MANGGLGEGAGPMWVRAARAAAGWARGGAAGMSRACGVCGAGERGGVEVHGVCQWASVGRGAFGWGHGGANRPMGRRWTSGVSGSDPSLLVFHAELGDLSQVEDLLSEGADVNGVDEYGWTALMKASNEGHADVVRALVGVDGIDVNAVSKVGRATALMRASAMGHADVVKVLVEVAGIDVNARNKDGRTALMSACAMGDSEVVNALLETPGIDVNATSREGETALALAQSHGHVDVAEVLASRTPLSWIPSLSKLWRRG